MCVENGVSRGNSFTVLFCDIFKNILLKESYVFTLNNQFNSIIYMFLNG